MEVAILTPYSWYCLASGSFDIWLRTTSQFRLGRVVRLNVFRGWTDIILEDLIFYFWSDFQESYVIGKLKICSFQRYATLKNLFSRKRAVISWMRYKCEIGTFLILLHCLTHSIRIAKLDFYVSHTVEKRKFLAFQWCITQVTPTRNEDFRPRSRIWDRSGIHLKRVRTLTVIRRYRDSRLRGLS